MTLYYQDRHFVSHITPAYKDNQKWLSNFAIFGFEEELRRARTSSSFALSVLNTVLLWAQTWLNVVEPGEFPRILECMADTTRFVEMVLEIHGFQLIDCLC